MRYKQVLAFVDRHVAAWNRHDPEVLCSHHTDDCVVFSPMFGRIQGRDQIRSAYTTLFEVFPDWQMECEAPLVDGTRVALHFTVSATHQGDFIGFEATGRRGTFEGVSIAHLREDLRIREERRVYDFTRLLSELGVLRVRPHSEGRARMA
jgi:C-1 hydroxylase